MAKLLIPIIALILVFIYGLLQTIFSKKFAKFFSKTSKYEWRPTTRPMPSSHYTPGLLRGIGIAMMIFSFLILLFLLTLS